MLLRSAIQDINGLRYMIEKLDIQSGLAKRVLYDTPYMTNPADILHVLGKIEVFYFLILTPDYKETLSNLRAKLKQVKDIRGTISRIKNKKILDDIELFELKVFSLFSQEIMEILKKKKIGVLSIPSLEQIINLLDPDKNRIPHFYIYDSYSSELTGLRKEIKAIKASDQQDESKLDKLYLQCVEIEDGIRKGLSLKIHEHYLSIAKALQDVAELDILIAKARQAAGMQLCKPEIAYDCTCYQGIFNPEIKSVLQADNKEYQPINISIEKGGTLITGANMTGKSVILKTVALAQALFQFGFYVPATSAEIVCVEDILLCIGDDQNELSGLSSYAAEMIKVNQIVQKTKKGKNILVLIDELARTTNPTEGKAIVNAVLDILTENNALALLTTHYSIKTECRKLRVVGFIEDKLSDDLTVENINKYIDYSLVIESGDMVPHEALKIARILGVDMEILKKAEYYLYNK